MLQILGDYTDFQVQNDPNNYLLYLYQNQKQDSCQVGFHIQEICLGTLVHNEK